MKLDVDQNRNLVITPDGQGGTALLTLRQGDVITVTEQDGQITFHHVGCTCPICAGWERKLAGAISASRSPNPYPNGRWTPVQPIQHLNPEEL